MRNKIIKLPLLLSLFTLLILMSVSLPKLNALPSLPDYSGKWDFFFYDATGKLQGKKTININEEGKFSDKVILNLNNIIYNTEVYGIITPSGSIKDGDLTDTDMLDMKGLLSGTFTSEEGSGTWKNYYKSSGTWKATRTPNQR